MDWEEHLTKLVAEGRRVVDEFVRNGSALPSGYKFVAHPERYIARVGAWLDYLAPVRNGASAFEIGPGCCYLLYALRQKFQCRVAGIDLMAPGQIDYATMRRLLGMEKAIRCHQVKAFRPVPYEGVYDYVLATGTMFLTAFTPAAHQFWLQDLLPHLKEEGRLFIDFNIGPNHIQAVRFYSRFGLFKSHSAVLIEKPALKWFLDTTRPP